MIHIGLFEGIGGFSLAAHWMGWKTLATCEIAEFPRKILSFYWPEAYHHDDIHTLTYETINAELSKRFGNWRTEDIIITGGFPCQPYSTAGKRLGKEDSRHLWPEMLRVIREVKPRYIVGENVRGLISWNGGMVFDEVQADLESEGYEVFPILLPAAGVNAPHRRDRIWFVAFNSKSVQNTEVGGIQERKNNESFGICSTNSQQIIAHTDNKRGSDGLGQIQATNGKVSERNNDAESCDSDNGSTTYTKGNGRGGWNSGECENGERELFQGKQGRSQMGSEVKGCGGERNATDSSNERLQGSKDFRIIGESRKKSYQQPTGLFQSAWQNFPIVSPICDGNDEFSDRLDSITFSKWRKESIKAGGNAVVPQVVLQIFKAIELSNSKT